jgi:hypothetical protein
MDTLSGPRSFQLRVSAPDGVEIVEGSLWNERRDGTIVRVDRMRGGKPVIQLQTADLPDGQVFAEVRFRASRHGWLRPLLASSMATAVLLGVGAWRLNVVEKSALATNNHTEAVAILAAVLLGLVGLMASMLVRSAEHAMLRRLLSVLRSLALGLGLLPLIAAGTLSVSCRFPKLPQTP